MENRSKEITRLLLICFSVSTAGAIIKIVYGYYTHSLSFVADGIHSSFDSLATIFGIISIIHASRPPDDGHPYGHEKFETVASMILSMLLIFVAWEVGHHAVDRLSKPLLVPVFHPIGLAILIATMIANLGVARLESRKAKVYSSHFLAADSAHNQSDFLITMAVLISWLSSRYKINYVDSVVSLLIALYLLYLSVRLIQHSVHPLVDRSVLDAQKVREIVSSVEGVLDCHAIRSRGLNERFFLDLNIHLPPKTTLDAAHQITHSVEDKLRACFPGLVDVVIHTEPHGHPPCSKD